MSTENKEVSRFDAEDSVFFERELEFIKSRTYDIKRPELKARALFPVSFEAGEGAESITYRQYDMAGMAKIISNHANDLPRVDVKGKEFTVKVKELGDSYAYTLKEIRSSRRVGKRLDVRRAEAARRALAELENRLVFSGDADAGIVGLLTHANVQSYTVPADGTGSSKLWTTKTPDQIVRDMNGMVQQIVDTTKGVEAPDTLLLPINQFLYISQTRMGTSSDSTILKFFLMNNPFIKQIEWVNELDQAGSGSTDVMVAYKRDPLNMSIEIPSDFAQLEPEKRGLEYVIDCVEEFAGLILYYPLSVCKGEGI